MPFNPRPSQAVNLWWSLVAFVLITLFFETRSVHHNGINFLINTGVSAVGAQVLIDNNKVGEISISGDSGPGGGVFWGSFRPGSHLVELHKNGFRAFSEQVDMHQETYMGVDLQPVNN